MSIREFDLPDDLEEMAAMAADSFQYPENPSWGIQEDEKETLIETFQSLRRSWWMVRIGQIFMPAMRDLINGLVWEEDGKIVSTVMVQKRGQSQNWMVGTVATLPEYRRRGYARKLVEGSLDLMRGKGAEIAVLDVISENVPAYTLYTSLGFEHFSGRYELEYNPTGVYPAPEWPDEIIMEPSSLFDWRPRFELIEQISPESLQKYEPPEEARFKTPAFLRFFYPILMQAQKMKTEVYLLRHTETRQVIGYLFFDIRTNNKGRHELTLRIAPEYAPYSLAILQHSLHKLTAAALLNIDMSVFTWEQHIADAAFELGFSQRVLYHRLGIKL